jgi:transposase
MEAHHAITLSDTARAMLESWVRAGTTPQRVVRRARIVLLAADGVSNTEIARQVGVSRPTVQLWRERFLLGGPAGLERDAPRSGRKSGRLSPAVVQAVVATTLHTQPPAATHWSRRTMAATLGISASSVGRIWKAHRLQPHRSETFKQSRDPRFLEKLTDVVGLYLNPPEKALVFCVDEKSQIQALERTRPVAPLASGRPERRTHDYRRHGTTTLFAALNMLDGRVVGECQERHTNEEFLAFLVRLDQETPAGLALHLIVDNYGTHKHPNVRAWLAEHPRFHLHFTPTSCSWANMVERFFAELTRKRLRRGSFRSVGELVAAIEEYLAHHNAAPKPLVWTAPVERIMDRLSRCKETSDSPH